MRNRKWLATIAILATLTFVTVLVHPYPETPVAQTPLAASWTMLGRDTRHSSWVPLAEAVGNITGPPTVKWIYTFDLSTEGWYSFHSQPVVADINGDGVVEVVAVDAAGRLVVLDGVTGARLAYTWTRDQLLGTHTVPVLADVDGDGVMEVVAGGRDGSLIVLEIDVVTGATTVKWRTPSILRRIDTSALVADIDSDQRLEAIVAGSGAIYCYDLGLQSLEWKARIDGAVMLSSPILVDTGTQRLIVQPDFYGRVYAFNAATGEKLWETDLWTSYNLGYYGYNIHSPVAGDVDGDGSLEVLIPLAREVFQPEAGKSEVRGTIAMLDASTGILEYFINYTDPNTPANSGPAPWFTQPGLSVADVDSDGAEELFIGGLDGALYRYDCTTTGCTLSWRILLDNIVDWWLGTGQDAPPSAIAVAVADIDNDTGYEVVAVSTRASFTTTSFNDYYYTVYSIDATTGTIEWSLDLTEYNIASQGVYSKWAWPSLALADTDNDGFLEILVTVYVAVYSLG